MNQDQKEIDTNLYSRQLFTFGKQTMGKLIKMRVLLSGLRGVGVQTVKNIILAGPKSVDIHDPSIVQLQETASSDLSKIKEPLEQFKRLSTTKIYPKNVLRYINSSFLKIEKPSKGTKRKIWNFLKATIIFMIEKVKSNRVSNSTNSNRSLSKRHAARVMREIKRGQSGGQRRSLLSQSTLSNNQSSINQNMFASLTPAQQQMLMRHKHNFVMDVQPKSKFQQQKKKRKKFSEYTKEHGGISGKYSNSLLDDNSNQGSGFGYPSSHIFTSYRTSGGRISSLNFQPRTAATNLNIQGLNATSEDSLSLSNPNMQQQFAPVIGKKQESQKMMGSPKILEPQFIGQNKWSQTKKHPKSRQEFQGTEIETAGWADSQESPQIETPQSHLKTRGSIFKNNDVYLYKEDKQMSDSKKNYLVVQLKHDKTQQRSPTAQLINLKTARAQAKRQLSKIGAMEDYNVVPVTNIVQSKDKRGSGQKRMFNSGGSSGSGSRITSPTHQMIKKLKKYSPVRQSGQNLIRHLKQIQKLESPKPRRSSSFHKRSVKHSSESKMKQINEQSQIEATPSNNFENRNLVQEFKAVANPKISQEQKINQLIAQNNKYLEDAQREQNELKIKLDQKFSEIQEEIMEQIEQNSPDKIKKPVQEKQQISDKISIQVKQTVISPPLYENREVPLYDSKEKKKTLHLIQDPIFEPAKDILEDTSYNTRTNYISKKIEQQRSQTQQSNNNKDHDLLGNRMHIQSPDTFLKFQQLQKSGDISENRSFISSVQIEVHRPRSESPKNFLLMQVESNAPQQQLPSQQQNEQSKDKQPKEEEYKSSQSLIKRQEKELQEAKNETRVMSPRTDKINQYKRIIQRNQTEPDTPPFEQRLRYQRIVEAQEEVQIFPVKRPESATSSVHQQAVEDILHRIRSARDERLGEKSVQKPKVTYIDSVHTLNESKIQQGRTSSVKEQRLDPDLQQSLRQISRKSIILKDANIIKNQYEVEEQKHLQELEKTLCTHQPMPQNDQTQELQTSMASNNLKDSSVLTLNQLSMQKQTPSSAAYYYKRHMNPGQVKSDTADPTASFGGIGGSRISDQVSNMPRKMVSGDTLLSGEQDLSLAQQNLQLRSAFKETLKGGSGDMSGNKRRLTQQISQACYKEVQKLIQQERREDQLKGMRRKSKYIEVKSKVKDYIEGRSFSRQYQKISDISAITNTQSSMRKTPVQESTSNKGSTQSFLLQRSKSPKIVREFHLSSTAAISSPNSARRPSKKSKKSSNSKKVKNEPIIQQRANLDIQEELKRTEEQIQSYNKNRIGTSSHTSGDILLPTIYTSTQNESPRIQSSPPSSSSRHQKIQAKKKESQQSEKLYQKNQIQLLKISPSQNQRSNKYLYQHLDASNKTEQDLKKQQRDNKKLQLLSKIEQISNQIREKTDESPKIPQTSSFLTQSFSYQNLRKNISNNRKVKGKSTTNVGSSLISHTQASKAKISCRDDKRKKPIVPRINTMRVETNLDNKFSLHNSYNSAPSSARSRIINKKSVNRGGVNYFHNKSTLTKKNEGNVQIDTHNRQLLSPELVQNLTLQSSIHRDEQSAPLTFLEPSFRESIIKNTPSSSSQIFTPRASNSNSVSKKQPVIISKVKKIKEFSSRPVNLNPKINDNISPNANSVTATKYSNALYSSNSSIILKKKSRSTPKLNLYKYQQNSYGTQQQSLNQNPRYLNNSNNQSTTYYRNRQPVQGKVTISTSQTTIAPSVTPRSLTSRNSIQASSSYSKLFSGVRRSQDDVLRNQKKGGGAIKIQRNVVIEEENKNDMQGTAKILKKKWLSKQMEREKKKMEKSYHHIISTSSSGLSSKSLTAQEWSKMKSNQPVQVIYQATQQSI